MQRVEIDLRPAKIMERRKMTHVGDVKKFFDPFHAEITVICKEKLTEAAVQSKITFKCVCVWWESTGERLTYSTKRGESCH